MLNIIITLISLTTFWSGLVYLVYALNILGVIISLILVLLSYLILHRFYLKHNKIKGFLDKPGSGRKKPLKTFDYLALSAYFLFIASCFIFLFISRTDKAIISPWQSVPGLFFIFYIFATILLFIILSRLEKYSVFFLGLHYFLSFSIALIVYRLGYGFDPFVHRATLDLIDKTGSVDPKPLYYLGQYGLLTILHKITFLPLPWLDKLLVPALSALLIPAALARSLKKWFAGKNNPAIVILILLIIPFSAFIVTTPQNLAYLFLVLALVFGLTCANTYDLLIIYLLSLAALITHPIAGIPALLFALALTVYHSDRRRFKRYLYYLIFILASVSLPLAFIFVGSSFGSAPGEAALPSPGTLWPRFLIPGQENFILNFIYFYGFNIKIILAVLAGLGVVIAYRHKENCRRAFPFAVISGGLLVSYFLSKKIDFGYLIDYERADFSNRLLTLSGFFLLPFFLLAIYSFIYKLQRQNKIIKISFVVFFSLLISVSLYLSYPRYDHYHNSHSYAASQNDIEAARWIENDASSSDYIVLANQQVSAAALSQFGFKKYYKNNIFYYPIPTGAPLYQYYLNMVYKNPSRETIEAAMDLAGVKTGYFVLNKYWWAFDKILSEAKLSADSWETIGSEDVYVFKYIK